MGIFRLKRKIYSKGFDSGTYNAMVNAAATNATPDAQAILSGYNKKYATEIAAYKNSTALTVPTTPKPGPTPKPSSTFKSSWGKMGTMGKVGTVGAVAAGGYFLGKGLGLWGKKKDK